MRRGGLTHGGRARKRKAVLAALLFALHNLACQDAEPTRPAAPLTTNWRAFASSDRAQSLAWNDPALLKPASALVNSVLDPRIEPLLRAADRWRKSRGPERRIVDQVYLVPDVPSFFEAIGHWDQKQFFPVLIDDPAWTLPFLRAFRPARVVRFRLPPRETARPAGGQGPVWRAVSHAALATDLARRPAGRGPGLDSGCGVGR